MQNKNLSTLLIILLVLVLARIMYSQIMLSQQVAELVNDGALEAKIAAGIKDYVSEQKDQAKQERRSDLEYRGRAVVETYEASKRKLGR